MTAPPLFLSRHGNSSSRIALLCFPYAGGLPYFCDSIARRLPKSIEVLTLDMDELHNQTVQTIDDCTQKISSAIELIDKDELLLYGHSMGGILAYETVRSLEALQTVKVRNLLISACPSPIHWNNVQHHRQTEHRYEKLLPKEALERDLSDATRKQLVSKIREDMKLLKTYSPKRDSTVSVPIVVMAGRQDTMIPIRSLLPWRSETSDRAVFHSFEGDHFFTIADPERVARCILSETFGRAVSCD